MTTSYSGDPSNSNLDAVRFHCGDTGPDFFLQDEEVQYLLSNENDDVEKSSVSACEAIAAKLSEEADAKAGDAEVEFSQRAQNFRDTADELRKQFGLSDFTPLAEAYAGGISESDKQSRRDDTDRVVPDFFKDMHENDTGAF